MNTICPIWIRSSLSFISHQLLTWLMIHNLPKRIHSMVGCPQFGLDRVWAQPASDPTLLGGATINRLSTKRMIGSSGLELQRMSGKSVGVEDLKNNENPAIWKTVEIWRKKKERKMAKIWQYLAKYSEISAIFDKILARSSEISLDLAYIFLKIS